jgi:flavodoxin
MDFFVQATLGREVQFKEDSSRMLETLKNIKALKGVKMTEVESSGKTWIEYEGSVDVPEGSKAFLALLKRKDQRDPYEIFLRIDINKEAVTREKAEHETKEWIEETFAKPLTTTMRATNVYIGTPLEIIKSKKSLDRQPKKLK